MNIEGFCDTNRAKIQLQDFLNPEHHAVAKVAEKLIKEQHERVLPKSSIRVAFVQFICGDLQR